MALIRALEFDQTPNRLLFEIGEQARQQELMRRKLAMENQEKQLQVLREINPATLYPKFEREVVDQTIGELTSGIANAIKRNPNASYIDLQNMVNQNLGQVAQWSAKVKSIKDNIDKSISLIDSKNPYDRGRLRALAIDRALYKTDESGSKILRGPDEIDLESDIISQVIADNEDKLIDPYKGEQAMVDKINDASLYTQNVEQTVETPDGRKTIVVGQKSSVPFFLEAKDGQLRVKQQENGYIDEDVFQRFYQDPSIRANINANAKSNMQKIGVPDSPEAFEYFKRAYLTTWLEGNKKGTIDRTDKTLYQKPTGGGGGTKTAEKKNDTNDYITRVMDVVNNGTSQQLADMLYEMRAGNGKYEVLDAKVSNKNKGFVIEFNTGEFDEDGNPIKSQQSFNPSSKTFAIDLARFYQQATGSDSKLEKNILTGKQPKPAAKTKTYVIGGKNYSMEQLKGMGYTEDQVNQAIKAGTVKLK